MAIGQGAPNGQAPNGQGARNEQDAPIVLKSSRFHEMISGQSPCLVLQAQKRVSLPPANKLVLLRKGMLAVDATPDKERFQVLDFMVAGDILSVSTMMSTPRISLRAITNTDLFMLDGPGSQQDVPANDWWQFLTGQCFKQLARLNVRQLMIGRLQTEARVASFILAFALRGMRNRAFAAKSTVELPMSRIDIANYLVINCDTLSRTMMRFCDCGLMERMNRHTIRVADVEGLKKRTPIADTLAEVFMTEDDWDEDFAPGAEGRSPRLAAGAETGGNPIGLTAYQSMVADWTETHK